MDSNLKCAHKFVLYQGLTEYLTPCERCGSTLIVVLKDGKCDHDFIEEGKYNTCSKCETIIETKFK